MNVQLRQIECHRIGSFWATPTGSKVAEAVRDLMHSTIEDSNLNSSWKNRGTNLAYKDRKMDK